MTDKVIITSPITFVTSNVNKLREVSSILGDSIPVINENIDCM